jgi:hypothetical protein
MVRKRGKETVTQVKALADSHAVLCKTVQTKVVTEVGFGRLFSCSVMSTEQEESNDRSANNKNTEDSGDARSERRGSPQSQR